MPSSLYPQKENILGYHKYLHMLCKAMGELKTNSYSEFPEDALRATFCPNGNIK